MDIAALGFHSESKNDTFPLLMERPESISSGDHVIDIARNGDSLPSSSAHSRPSSGLNTSWQDRPSNNARATMPLPLIPSSNVSTSRNSSFLRRGETRRRRSPLNSGLWISIELVLTIGQIFASVVVLSLSRHERPRTPLFAWVVGYALGCVATLPLLYWRYRHHSQLPEQDLAQPRQGSQINVSAVPFSLSVSRTPEGEDRRSGASSSESRQGSEIMNARLKALVEYFKMALDCFFAIWFVVGNVWIFGGHSSADQAPNLYRLCIVFLTFSCIGYAMPFILCATICCCLPCIISALGFREDLTQNQGATSESIDALPTYKFKIKKIRNGDDRDGVFDGGVIAAGTDKERVISWEDAVCCICLAKYVNNDELRELPCFHFFHKECVDKWLKINASCPLCKSEVGESPLMGSLSGANAGRPNNDF